MPIRKYNPTSPGVAAEDVADLRRDHDQRAVRAADREAATARAAATTRAQLTSWWRGGGHKRLYRDHRLQARQEGHPRKVDDGRVRPEPLGAHRAAHLRRRREALHPAAGGHEGGRHGRGRRHRRHPAGQLPAAEEHSARHARSTTSSCGRARAARSRAAPARRCSWWRAKATTRRSSCRRARSGRSTSSAWRRSARSATSITRTCRSARPDAAAGSGKRPHVRGVAMNPVDHPLGGGEGKTSGGRHPVTPWGQPTKGYKTRNRKNTDRFIVQRRPK